MQPIDFNGLDTTVHGPIRLGVLTALQLAGPHDFTTLKKRLGVADGSLSLQLQKLEEAEYITSTKYFAGRLPKTEYRLTPAGRKAFETYLDQMEALIRAARER